MTFLASCLPVSDLPDARPLPAESLLQVGTNVKVRLPHYTATLMREASE